MTTIIDMVMMIDPSQLTVEDQEFSDDPDKPILIDPDSCFIIASARHVTAGQASGAITLSLGESDEAGPVISRWRAVTLSGPPGWTAVINDIHSDGEGRGGIEGLPTARYLDRHLTLPPMEGGPVSDEAPWKAIVDRQEYVIELPLRAPERLNLTIGFHLVAAPRGGKPMVTEGYFQWHGVVEVA